MPTDSMFELHPGSALLTNDGARSDRELPIADGGQYDTKARAGLNVASVKYIIYSNTYFD